METLDWVHRNGSVNIRISWEPKYYLSHKNLAQHSGISESPRLISLSPETGVLLTGDIIHDFPSTRKKVRPTGKRMRTSSAALSYMFSHQFSRNDAEHG